MAEITYVQLIGILNLFADAKENKIQKMMKKVFIYYREKLQYRCPKFTCSNLTIKTLEQGVKHVQS